jgi:hypothetical protein
MTTSTHAVGALRAGDPDVAGPLAVFPVFADPTTLEFRAFAEAAALGAAACELEPANVNAVLVHNPLDVPVLLYEGEQIAGAQQDRTLDISVLVDAGARQPVPVSCVESGRWDGSRHDESFAPAAPAAYPELRRAKHRAAMAAGQADQGEVWSLVSEKHDRHGVAHATGAMTDVFVSRADDVGRLRTAIGRRDGQVGAVAAIGGALCVADVVGRSDVFAALHGPLVSGYALDALEHADAAPPAVDDVQRFLAAALSAAAVRERRQVGLGELWRFGGTSAQGSKLVAGGELIALTAFPGETPRTRVGRPSRRR